jgi:hypothetical protein
MNASGVLCCRDWEKPLARGLTVRPAIRVESRKLASLMSEASLRLNLFRQVSSLLRHFPAASAHDFD